MCTRMNIDTRCDKSAVGVCTRQAEKTVLATLTQKRESQLGNNESRSIPLTNQPENIHADSPEIAYTNARALGTIWSRIKCLMYHADVFDFSARVCYVLTSMFRCPYARGGCVASILWTFCGVWYCRGMALQTTASVYCACSGFVLTYSKRHSRKFRFFRLTTCFVCICLNESSALSVQ